jgi:hypothetical protein
MGLAEKRRVLIVVRTYPTPAKKGVEVSCTAAITENGEWMRLFPIPYRFLDTDQRFRKYQWVEVGVKKASDARPESYNLIGGSIKILSPPMPTTHDWAERKRLVFPLLTSSLCSLQAERDAKRFPTLGIFRPKTIKRLIIKPESAEWSEDQLAILRQGDLFRKTPIRELEKVPFKFVYEFNCNDVNCTGHNLSCTDWEMGQLWRQWRDKYGDGWEEKFRQRYETEMINDRDTHFYVGTVHQHPASWIIVGLFYPPKRTEQSLTLF